MNLNRRHIGCVLFALAVAAVGIGLFLQHHLMQDPCPLCIVQRIILITIGCLGLLSALLGRWHRFGRLLMQLSVVSALVGMGVASWHIYLQAYPPENAQCGAGLEFMLATQGLAQVLPKIFAGHGECSEVGWRLFDVLTIPQMTMALFVLMLVLSVMGIRRAR